MLRIPLVWSCGIIYLVSHALAGTAGDPDRPVAGAPEVPAAAREFRGVWVATVANIDWPSRPGLPAATQREELRQLMDRAVQLNLNAIILQVRPAADALYASALEPWSEFLTGTMGEPPSEPYDPLATAIDAAHRRGLELHAWFNPYRALHPSARGPIAANHVSKTHPEWVRNYGNYLWLDPGEPAAVDHTMNVILDVVRRYDLDGVHLDDYFYPYPIQDDTGADIPFPDDTSWSQAVASHDPGSGPMPSRDDWRRRNVDRFIERLDREIKAEKPWVKFGISPFGIWRPGHPRQIEGFDPYSHLYADARKWVRAGWLDYATPQLYWRMEPPAQSYPVLLNWWHEQNVQGRHLWPGNFTSRLRGRGHRDWTADEILAQIECTRQQTGATGNIHFSMKALAENAGSISDRLRDGPYREPALVPVSDWLAGAHQPIPAPPAIEVEQQDGIATVRLRPVPGSTPWLVVARCRYGDRWQIAILPGQQTEYKLASDTNGQQVTAIAVSGVNRIGQEGPIAWATVTRH